MPWTQAGSAVVVLAEQFNPSVVTHLWLKNNRILADEDFQEGSIYSDFLVQVRSRLFHMLVLPDQLQFMPVVAVAEQQQLITEKLGAIIQLLPQTPYRALDLTFRWHLTTPGDDIGAVTRRLFCCGHQRLYQHFREQEARFGAYLSKNVAGFCLRLDIKPMSVAVEGTQEQRIQFTFHFHRDIGDGGAPQVGEGLKHWDEVRQEAECIIDSVEPINQVSDNFQPVDAVQPGERVSSEVSADEPEVLRTVFRRFVTAWKKEKRFLSSMKAVESLPHYRGIIALGEPVVPLLFEELERDPDYWFTALHTITGENPVPTEDRGDLTRMTKHWLDWGRRTRRSW
jgi:hypothetical protein